MAANIYQLRLSQDTSKQAVDNSLVSNANLIVNQVDNWVELNLKSSDFNCQNHRYSVNGSVTAGASTQSYG